MNVGLGRSFFQVRAAVVGCFLFATLLERVGRCSTNYEKMVPVFFPWPLAKRVMVLSREKCNLMHDRLSKD